MSTQSEAKRNATVDITLARAAPAHPFLENHTNQRLKKDPIQRSLLQRRQPIEGVLASPLALKIELPYKRDSKK